MTDEELNELRRLLCKANEHATECYIYGTMDRGGTRAWNHQGECLQAAINALDVARLRASHLPDRVLLVAILEDVTESLNATDPKCTCDAAIGSRELANPPGGFHDESCRIGKIVRARAALAQVGAS